MEAILHNIAAAALPLGGSIYLLFATGLIDTVTGIWAALKTPGAFDMQYVDTFIRSHILQRWGPIVGTLLGGVAIGGTDTTLGSVIVAAGVAQIAAYEAATVASVFGIGSTTDGNLKAAQLKTKGLPTSVAVKAHR